MTAFQNPDRSLRNPILQAGIYLMLTLALVNGCRTTEPKNAPAPAVAEETSGFALPGISGDEANRLGERIYREGLLPSGEAVQAVVQGDVPVDGRMFTCVDCHLPSGLGTIEGQIFSPRVNGPELYRGRRLGGAWSPSALAKSRKKDVQKAEELPPLSQAEDLRPAYTDETLSEAIRTGLDSAARPFNPIMPKYLLDDRDMALLIHYLKNLSAEWDPGVTDTTIRFATVVGTDVDRADREAMLGVIEAYIADRNAQPRHQARRARRGPYYRSEKNVAFREIEHEVWELSGPAVTWRTQLEDHYARNPVFGLLGGMVRGDWEPIHRFCEENRIPNLFPVTDYPVISDTDWYTIYISKGFYQEGETAARFLRKMKKGRKPSVLQIYRTGGPGERMARGFSETWNPDGLADVRKVALSGGEPVSEDLWPRILKDGGVDVLLVWLGEESASLFGSYGRLRKGSRPDTLFVSDSLMGPALKSSVPDAMRPIVWITHPGSMDRDNEKKRRVLEGWLRVKNVPATRIKVQAQMYFLGWMLSGSLGDMRSEFYRDYFLEGIDMMVDQTYSIAVYPRLSFGPGQRYASKGCYVVQLTGGPQPIQVRKSGWVVH